MSQLPIESAIPRFKANEERIDDFVNGPGYNSTSGQFVPSLSQQASMNGTLIPVGAFVPGRNYVSREVYTFDSIAYIVIKDHVSTNVPADVAAGKVTVYQNGVSGAFSPNQIPKVNTANFAETVSIRNWGGKGDGSYNETIALRKAKLDTNRVFFPKINGMPTVYYFENMVQADMTGMFISAEDGVSFKMASNEYLLYSGAVFESDIPVFFQDISTKYVFVKTPPKYKKNSTALSAPPSKRYNTALDVTSELNIKARKVTWPTGDDFIDAVSTRTANSITLAAGGGIPNFKGAFFELGPYETISAVFDGGYTSGPIGVIIRSETGFYVIYRNGDVPSENYFVAMKPTGQPLQGNNASLSWGALGQGRYSSFDADKSVWSITRTAVDRVVVKLNGCALTGPDVRNIGHILEVGFVSFTDSAFTISGFTHEHRIDAIHGAQRIDKIRFFGDSRIAPFPGAASDYVKPILDGEFGLKIVSVDNYGVAGTSLAQALASLIANGTGGAYYTVLVSATNSIQGLISLADFKLQLEQFADGCHVRSSIPVFAVPGMFYTQAQSGGIGQNSANYASGSKYRMILERVACEKGCVLVKLPEDMPNPDPAYLTSDPGFAILRDNIHEDNFGELIVAKAICQAIADDFLSLPDAIESKIGAFSFGPGASSADFRFSVNKGRECGFGGTIDITNIANGSPVIKPPRWARPRRNTNFIAQAVTASGNAMLGPCYLNYNPATGYLELVLAPATTGKIILDSCSYLS